MKKINKIIALFVLVFFLGSCEQDFLDTSPTDQFSSDLMFESIEGANLALNGMYRYLYAFHPGFGWGYGNHDGFGHMAHNLEMDLMGEDMRVFSAGYGWFNGAHRWITHRNAMAGVTHERWRMPYAVINNANILILYIDDVDAPQTQLNRIKAQAYAARGAMLYHLAMLYAPAYTDDPGAPGLPLYNEPGQEGFPRSSVEDTYAMITSDLDEAIALFDGTNTRPHRSHINLAVAHGYRARVALAMGDWQTAHANAIDAIDYHGGANELFTQGDYPDKFEFVMEDGEIVGYDFDAHAGFNDASASSEWMWGSIINEEHATIYASFMSHMDPRFMTYAALGGQKMITPPLYEAMGENDVRRNLFMLSTTDGNDEDHGGYSDSEADIPPYTQLKLVTQAVGAWEADYIYMRLAEMFVIKAEAEARLGLDADAVSTLHDLVTTRDADYDVSGLSGNDLIEEVMLQRRIELWGEGFRWIDLKRLGLDLDRNDMGHDPGMASEMFVEAGHRWWNWLIPQDELDANDQIGPDDQNP